MASDPTVLALSGDPLVSEAMERWKRCAEWESVARERWLEDYRFASGDPYNNYQWPNTMRSAREISNKPCLTMNMVRQHNLIISNDMRKAKASVRFRPMGDGASVDAAKVREDIMRDIEINSGAQSIYTKARNFMVGPGLGWWRVVTQYPDTESFDQEIFLMPVNDPLSVFVDPDAQQADLSDAKFAFVFDYMQRKDFDKEFPQYVGKGNGQNPLGIGLVDMGMDSQDRVWYCEYFRKVTKPDTLVSFVHLNERKTIKLSMLADNMLEILDSPSTRTRPIQVETIEWYMLVGEEVVDETTWPGKYIPLVRCVGEEEVIDGVMDRKGHTRAMIDAQRMYNYSASSQVEHTGLQGKTPWVAPAAAIEGYQQYWDTANVLNHSVLPYNAVDDEGNKLDKPERAEGPRSSEAYQIGMQTALQQIMMVSGQYQNSLGEAGNERTGAAIGKRQEQGATATYHFQDNYEAALIYTGKIILDLFPKIYDTRRVKRMTADDGSEYDLTIDPTHPQAMSETRDDKGQVVARVLNPTLGAYDVMPQAGPSYTTKRQETADSLTLVLTQAPTLIPIIGDLLLASLEFDKAQEAAQRMKRMVPKAALGEGPGPVEQHLQAQVQQLSGALAKALQQAARDQLKLAGKDQMRDIDTYKAETDRIKALIDILGLNQDLEVRLLDQLAADTEATNIGAVASADQKEIAA